jgi:hypothetical protein
LTRKLQIEKEAFKIIEKMERESADKAMVKLWGITGTPKLSLA